VVPKSWLDTVIYPVAKKGDFNGDLDNLRPITLIDICRKIFSTMMTTRLSNVIDAYPIFGGQNLGATKGKEALDGAHILNSCIEHAFLTNSPIATLLLDIKKAYDSVTFETLRISMRRLKIPENFIDLITHIASHRSVQVITRYGLTVPFRPSIGIEQGEVNAPLFWKIVYDPLLTALKDTPIGYRLTSCPVDPLKLTTPASLHPIEKIAIAETLPIPEDLLINNIAFVDDLTLICQDQESMELLLQPVESFMNLHNITINPTKTVFAYRQTEYRILPPLQVAGAPVGSILSAGESFRILGVWLSTHCLHHEQFLQLKEISHKAANILKRKVLTDKLISYIFNTVVLPRLLYKATHQCLSQDQLDIIESPWRAIIKRKSGLPSSICNSTLFSGIGYGLTSLKDIVPAVEITNFSVWLNDNGQVGGLTRSLFRLIQDRFHFPAFPGQHPRSLSLDSRLSFLHVLNSLDLRCLSLPSAHPWFVRNSRLHEENDYLMPLLLPSHFNAALPRLTQLQLFFKSQLYLEDGSVRSWQDVSGSSGRTPQWFVHVTASLTASPLPRIITGPNFLVEVADVTVVPATAKADYSDTIAWTDGSLVFPTAACAVYSNSFSTDYVMKQANGLSSTTSELAGIFSAIYHHNPAVPLTIYSDSQAAVYLTRKPLVSTRELLRNPNGDILDALQAIAGVHAAPITLNWIPGHAGNVGNEAAHRLATSARAAGNGRKLPRMITRVQFRLHCQDEPIYEYPRKFMKQQALIAHTNAFLWSRHGANLKQLSPEQLAISSRCLQSNLSKESRLFTSRSNSTFRAFRWKLACDLLPIGSRHLKWGCQARPDGTCPLCVTSVETVAHLFSCPFVNRADWPSNLRSCLQPLLPHLDCSSLATDLICNDALATSFGCLTKELEELLMPLTSSTISISSLSHQVLRGCHHFLYQYVWKPRCESVAALHPISLEQKRTYSASASARPASTNPYKLGLSRFSDKIAWTFANGLLIR
jgi:ribonuclease HI